MKSERNRRARSRDDEASKRRAEQRHAERSLQRLLLTLLMSMLAVAIIGYALALWWR